MKKLTRARRVRAAQRSPGCNISRPSLDRYLRLSCEPLEDRRMLAVLVKVDFEFFDPSNLSNPVTSVAVNHDFVLRAYVTDNRPTPQGIFQAYFDVAYTPTLASHSGPIVPGDQYDVLPTGSAGAAGSLNVVGGTSDGLPNPRGGRFPLFSTTFHATSGGAFSVTAQPSSGNPVQFWDSLEPVLQSSIEYSGGSIQILGGPSVSSIVRANPNPTNASSVQYTVTFSEPVTSVDAGDFALAGVGVTNAQITGVTPLPTASSNVYTVTVSTGSGDGTLGLNLVDNDSIKNSGNQSLGGTGNGNGNFTGDLYTIDRTPPTTNPDPYTVAEDGTLAIGGTGVLSNDSDALATTLTAALVNGSGPAHGSLTLNPNGSFTYTPEGNYSGPDSFQYTASDGANNSAATTVSITVTAVNDAPNPSADSVSTAEDTALNIPAASLVTNDAAGPANETGQTLVVVGVTSGPNTHGAVSLVGGTITYTPDPDYNGPASFTYTVQDNGTTNGNPDFKQATGTVNVTVTAANDPPVRTAGSFTALGVAEDANATPLGLGSLAYGPGGGSDEASQSLSVTVTTLPPANVGTVLLADGVTPVNATTSYTIDQLRGMQFKPAPNATGNTTFAWQVRDTGGGTDALQEAPLQIAIAAVNDPPARTAGTVADATIRKNAGPTPLGLANVAYGPGGGSDESGQTLTITVTEVPLPSLGTIVLADGTTVVTANTDYTLAQLQGMQFKPAADVTGGPQAFRWRVKDSGGTTGGGNDTLNETINIVVAIINGPPVLIAGTVNNKTVLEDSPISSLGLADVDYSPGTLPEEAIQTLTYRVTQVPAAALGQILLADGTTVVTANTQYTLAELRGMQFKPVANANGTGSFTWTVKDNGGTDNGGVDTLEQTIQIAVTAVNDPPIRTAGTIANLTVLEDAPATSLGLGQFAYGQGGGADESVQALSVIVTALPTTVGSIVLADGVTVVNMGTPYTVQQLQGMQFKAGANANGSGSFAWSVVDSGGLVAGGNDTLQEPALQINVTALNDAPVRTAGSVADKIFEKNSGTVSLGLAGLDYGPGGGSDETGQTLTYKVTALPTAALGTVTLDDGTPVTANTEYTLAQLRGLKFQVAADHVGGPESLTWTVVDDGGTTGGGADTLLQTIQITVAIINRPPVRIAGTVNNPTVLEDSGTTSLGLGALDYSPGTGPDDVGQTLTYIVTTLPSADIGSIVLADGTTTVTSNTEYTLAQLRGMQFKTAANGNGVVTFGWNVKDSGGTANGGVDTLAESLQITVTAVNDPPVRTAGTVANRVVAKNSAASGLGLEQLDYSPGPTADEAAQTLTYTVTAVPSATLGAIVLADGTTLVTVNSSYTLEQLRGMQFKPTANAIGGPETFSWAVKDSGGAANGGVDTLAQSMQITVVIINLPPVRSAGNVNDLTVLEDSGTTSLGLDGLAYSPGNSPDDANQTLTFTVTGIPAATLGTVVLADGTTAVTANSSYTLDQLRGMRFKAAADASGTGVFSWTVRDSGGTENGGVDTLAESLDINVTPVNDQPSRTAGTVSNLTATEDAGATSLGLGGLNYSKGGGSDEGSQTLTIKVTAVPTASQGTILLADGTSFVIVNGVYTLDQLRGMQFKPAANANGAAGTFSWSVIDSGGTGNGGVDTLVETPIQISITAVNDPPARTGGTVANLSVQQDSATTSLGLAGLTYSPGGGSDESAQSLTFTVTSVPAASLGSIVLADGTTVVTTSTTFTLDQIRGMQFKPAAGATGSGAFAWQVRDSGGTASGGNDTLTESLAITVNSSETGLSGVAFNDANRNGGYDVGEVLLRNVKINLTGSDNDGNPVSDSTTTDDNGFYDFPGLRPGKYQLSAAMPAHLNSGTATVGTNGGNVSSQSISDITLNAGSDGSGYNFGAYGLAKAYVNLNLFLTSTPPADQLLNPQTTIKTLPPQTIHVNTSTPPIRFTLHNPLFPAARMTVSGTSSNTTLVPHQNIVYRGSGNVRTIQVTPAANQTGTATITTTVTDEFGNQAAMSFALSVVEGSSTATAIAQSIAPTSQSAGDAQPLSASSTSTSSLQSDSNSPSNESAVDEALATEESFIDPPL
jgi:VCBS repeat-containing protein